MLDRDQVCCSAGSACRTGSLEFSHVLRAMKLGTDRARGSMRFSFGRFNTEAEVDKSLEIDRRATAAAVALKLLGGILPIFSDCYPFPVS